MAMNQLFNRTSGGTESEPATPGRRTGLARLLETGLALSDGQRAKLEEACREGLAFYEEYNNTRLELAFSCFDREMRLAVYELLFLLNVNDPRLAHFRYLSKQYVTRGGARRQVATETAVNLYVEGAPAGVRAIRKLPDFLRAEYESYVEGVFGMPPYGAQPAEWAPIVTVQSVGSIGTVGHKTKDSDLDLQVVYDLSPFVHDTGEWHDGVFKDAINREHRWWINALRRQQKLSVEQVRQPEVQKRLSSAAAEKVRRAYPGLYRYLVEEDREFATTLLRSNDKTLRIQVLHEVLNLMKRAEKITQLGPEQRQREALLKERLKRVQAYINGKFPEAEIYLFVYPVEGFRQGQYSSTLEFKESSGSAYELILNYDTLMPGIQFTPMVPTHFLLPQAVNNDTTLFNRLIDYTRYQALDVFDHLGSVLVDLGPTPDLDERYVAQHGGAIYWEAFKASSGNLPKAILNLFRFEMLLDKRFLQTTIQMIKEPWRINKLASRRPPAKTAEKQRRSTLAIIGREKQPAQQEATVRFETADDQLEAMATLRTGLPPWSVLEMEEEFPQLTLDPWWLRYKALKIGFGEPEGVPGIPMEERHRISKVIDLAFCLHLRISDVLNQSRDEKAKQKSRPYRERVLLSFLERAFPAGSARRINLESLLSGGVRGLIFFENEMRELFQRSMTRVEEKMAKLGIRDHVGDKREVDLWINYYVENFQPMGHVVPRVIMKHLKVARDGIQIVHRPGEGWVFMAVQRRESILEAAKAAREVSYLPEKILLLENAGFLNGLAHCILNGYYGVLRKGTAEQHFTVIEMNHRKVDMGQNVHNELAFVTEEQVRELAERVAEFFRYQPYNYLDILRKERQITGVFVFVNLWKFGLVSVLYRDNLSTWYCEEFEVREMFEQALDLTNDLDRFLRFKPMHETLAGFFRKRRVNLNEVALSAWANANSLTPDHTVSFRGKLQDMASGVTLRELILRYHGIVEVEGAAPAAG